MITIVVLETNDAPELAAISDIHLYEGDSLSIEAVATDNDLPPDQISYSLQPGVPAGAVLNPASGLLTWVPTEAQAASTNRFTIRATDTGSPAPSFAWIVIWLVVPPCASEGVQLNSPLPEMPAPGGAFAPTGIAQWIRRQISVGRGCIDHHGSSFENRERGGNVAESWGTVNLGHQDIKRPAAAETR